MGRSALTLLLAAVVAVAVGSIATVQLASMAVATSAEAANESTDVGTPEGYGSR